MSLVSDVRRNPKSGSRSLQKLNSVKEVKLSGKGSSDDGKNSISTSSGSTERHSNVESETDAKASAEKLVVETNDKEREEDDFSLNYRYRSPQEDLQEENRSLAAETMPVSMVDKVHEAKMAGDVGRGQLRSAISRNKLNAVSRNSTSDDLKRVSSIASNGSSVSDTDSGSSSDSESEREKEERRKKRERVLAEKAAAKAISAIKERENMVAKLEGENQSLEKILEERAKHQEQEVTVLRTVLYVCFFTFVLYCLCSTMNMVSTVGYNYMNNLGQIPGMFLSRLMFLVI